MQGRLLTGPHRHGATLTRSVLEGSAPFGGTRPSTSQKELHSKDRTPPQPTLGKQRALPNQLPLPVPAQGFVPAGFRATLPGAKNLAPSDHSVAHGKPILLIGINIHLSGGAIRGGCEKDRIAPAPAIGPRSGKDGKGPSTRADFPSKSDSGATWSTSISSVNGRSTQSPLLVFHVRSLMSGGQRPDDRRI